MFEPLAHEPPIIKSPPLAKAFSVIRPIADAGDLVWLH